MSGNIESIGVGDVKLDVVLIGVVVIVVDEALIWVAVVV